MSVELDTLIDESLVLRQKVRLMQEEYDGKRKRIFEILTAENQKVYVHGMCRAVRTEAITIESLSRELFVKALQEVDIEREKKVFIWNHAIKEVHRPATVLLQTLPGAKAASSAQAAA